MIEQQLTARADWAEARRQERHHDVLCRVIDKLLEAQLRRDTTNGDLLDKLVGVHMEIARAYADLAYPPPKAGCALVNCDCPWPHDHPVSGPYCTPPKAEAK